jgi:hypothetical protein
MNIKIGCPPHVVAGRRLTDSAGDTETAALARSEAGSPEMDSVIYWPAVAFDGPVISIVAPQTVATQRSKAATNRGSVRSVSYTHLTLPTTPYV